MEILVNVQSNFNEAIVLSFHGETYQAVHIANYQWLMFYPCLYFFAMWDAWKDADDTKEHLSFLPLVFSAYFVTVGCIYSSSLKLFGFLLGPIWLPINCVVPGVGVGFILKWFIHKIVKRKITE